MDEPQITLPRFPTVVDSTMMVCGDACQRKLFNEYCRCIAPLAISPDLHAGGAFSRGIEITRREFFVGGKSQSDAFALGARGMIEFWGEFTPPDKSAKTLENMIGALEDYLREYPLDSDPYKPVARQDGTPAIEFTAGWPTRIPHPETGDPILYGGRFDMLAENSGVLFIVDEKTTGRTPYRAEELYSMRGQFIGYCFLAQQYGFDVSRAVARIVVILKTKYHHLPVLEEYQQWQIDRWWEHTQRKIEGFVEAWKHDDWLYSYGSGCDSYSGCSFLPLCTSLDEEMHLDDYQHRFWNPLERDPTWPEGGPKYETVEVAELMKG